MRPKFTTYSPARRGCGHAHRTLSGARRCVAADARKNHGSDRMIIEYDGDNVRLHNPTEKE